MTTATSSNFHLLTRFDRRPSSELVIENPRAFSSYNFSNGDFINMDLNQTSLPLLDLSLSSIDAPEFDYSTFLQEDDMDYLAEDSASTSATMTDATVTSVVVPSTSVVKSSAAAGKQRMERRGHTKSRRGCFNCKRRRIKCQETRPSCGHCVKTGLNCEYPAVPQVTHQPQHQIPLFSLQDMRFFQHFLLKCYPHHPLGNDSIWTHEVPCLSQNYEYLMHAILGLAASDLLEQDPSLVAAAMMHRVKAIKAIKRALAEVPRAPTFEEGNALMATCYALTFQSVLLDDGMIEYMTFIRGIVIVAMQMYMKGARFMFTNFLGDDQLNLLRPFMESLPLIRSDWTDVAVRSIRALEPLCRENPVDREYHRHITEMAGNLRVSSFVAFQSLTKHYGWWIMMPHEQFKRLADLPNQPVSILLATHWIALKQIMVTITEAEYRARDRDPTTSANNNSQRSDGGMDVGIIRWLRHLNRMVEPAYRMYNTWPEWVEEQLDLDPKYFGKTR